MPVLFNIFIKIILLVCLASTIVISDMDAGMYRTYFDCPPCNEEQCPLPSPKCHELVKEAGVCGCCMKCAKTEGERCGVNLPRCMTGLKCLPPGGMEAWPAFLNDKGICLPTGEYFGYTWYQE